MSIATLLWRNGRRFLHNSVEDGSANVIGRDLDNFGDDHSGFLLLASASLVTASWLDEASLRRDDLI